MENPFLSTTSANSAQIIESALLFKERRKTDPLPNQPPSLSEKDTFLTPNVKLIRPNLLGVESSGLLSKSQSAIKKTPVTTLMLVNASPSTNLYDSNTTSSSLVKPYALRSNPKATPAVSKSFNFAADLVTGPAELLNMRAKHPLYASGVDESGEDERKNRRIKSFTPIKSSPFTTHGGATTTVTTATKDTQSSIKPKRLVFDAPDSPVKSNDVDISDLKEIEDLLVAGQISSEDEESEFENHLLQQQQQQQQQQRKQQKEQREFPYYTKYPHFLSKEYFLEHAGKEKPIIVESSSDDTRGYFETAFNLMAHLGSGEFSEAFAVQAKSDQRLYAVKRTKFPYLGQSERLRKLEEVEILWKIGPHPNCVQLFAAWEQKGHLFFQTELCARGNLKDWLDSYCQSKALKESRIWRITAALAQGLRHIHQCGVIHLDVKPENVFISQDWQLKIGDFGLAGFWPCDEDVEREGDRTYLAPEVLTNHHYSPAADVYSLGLIVLELAANVQLPEMGDAWRKLREDDFSDCDFQGRSTTLVETVKALMASEVQKRQTIEWVIGKLRGRAKWNRSESRDGP